MRKLPSWVHLFEHGTHPFSVEGLFPPPPHPTTTAASDPCIDQDAGIADAIKGMPRGEDFFPYSRDTLNAINLRGKTLYPVPAVGVSLRDDANEARQRCPQL